MKNALGMELVDALAWQAEMGADLCVETSPQILRADAKANVPPGPSLRGANATRQSTFNGVPASQTPQDGLPRSARNDAAPASSTIAAAIAEARALADAATTLAELETAVRNFNGCALKRTATTTVFAQGVPESRVMFVGEAPGAEEDRQGVPFCGPSGQLLDLMLSFIGLDRATNFYITNTLFWRPPGNRQPTVEELDICRPFVEKHIALVNPRALTLVGGTATKALLGESRGITKIRGQIFSYSNQYLAAPVPVHVIYHPSYLLRQPLAKKQCWQDLLALKAKLTESA